VSRLVFFKPDLRKLLLWLDLALHFLEWDTSNQLLIFGFLIIIFGVFSKPCLSGNFRSELALVAQVTESTVIVYTSFCYNYRSIWGSENFKISAWHPTSTLPNISLFLGANDLEKRSRDASTNTDDFARPKKLNAVPRSELKNSTKPMGNLPKLWSVNIITSGPKHFTCIDDGHKNLRDETLRRRQTRLAQRNTREPRARSWCRILPPNHL